MDLKIYIKPSELILNHTAPVPVPVQDKILIYHIAPVNRIRQALGFPIWASQRSGYRTKIHEVAFGRGLLADGSGSRKEWSRHTFEPCPSDPEGKGAVDWTCDMKYRGELGLALWKHTEYHRVAVYPWGFHADYKKVTPDRQLLIGSSWEPVELEKFMEEIWSYSS